MYLFAKLNSVVTASRLISESGYYGWVEPDDLEGVDIYGMVEEITFDLIACVVIVRMGAQAYLDYLAVRQDKRGEGVAAELLAKTAVDLKKHGVRKVHTCVSGENGAAAKMLTKFGAKIGWPYINGLITLEDDHG